MIRFIDYQGFNLVGNTSIEFSKMGEYSFDFYKELSFSSIENKIVFCISKPFIMTLTYFNRGESTDKVAVENEKMLILKNDRVIIPLKIITDKKYIKITSTVDGFYWEYQYSQTPDINYLPKLSYKSKHFQKGKTVYIDNPYIYKKIKTNYNWFISFIHYNDEEATFYYEYTNENENENGNNSSSYVYLWIALFILFIAIIAFVAWLFYIKKKKESIAENLINHSPNQKMM